MRCGIENARPSEEEFLDHMHELRERREMDARHSKLRPVLHGMLESANEHMEDAPDGAWMQHLEDAVTGFNQMNGTHFDPHESVAQWLQSMQDYEASLSQ